MGWKNCLVIVKEKINPINYSDGSWSCAVLGLDNEEGAKFCQLVIDNYLVLIQMRITSTLFLAKKKQLNFTINELRNSFLPWKKWTTNSTMSLTMLT